MAKLGGAERERLWAGLFKDRPDPDSLSVPTGTAFVPIGPGQGAGLVATFSLARHPDDAVPWLREKMGPPPAFKNIPRLIEDLESGEFETREKASRELEQLGQPTRSYLEKALAKGPPAETKRQAERLLDKLRDGAAAYELRQLRIIDLLEHINSAAARELLKQIAEGSYDPSFAEEAKQALRRAAEKP
jgi:hypothetical protein